ncbi:MAG: dihydropteroate synthase [Oscillospiraceae bacterium]|nr:dihydropteroate synthase [Oscillospiraceae bacterium]
MFDLIIGEKLNSSVAKTIEAFENRDENYIIDLIKNQEYAGASYLDVNTAMCASELETMIWVIDLILNNSTCGIVLDSINADLISQCAAYIKNRNVIINSVTLKERIDDYMPIAVKYNTGIIAMTIEQFGKIAASDERVVIAEKLIDKLTGGGIKKENIYLDAVVDSLITDDQNARITLETIYKLKKKDVKVICGISNVSYGLPKRVNINSSFLSMAILCGADGAILDITSPVIQAAIHSANLLSGNDEFCMNFIENMR